VVCSDPFYKAVILVVSEIPPTAVGGWFRSFLLAEELEVMSFSHGPVFPEADLNNPPTPVGGFSI